MICDHEPERPSADDTSFERLLEHEREEAAEHADGFVELMEERPGRERVFSCSEGLLHRPQLLVAENGHQRIEVGVGALHEDAIEFLLLLDLVGIDCEVLIADRVQVRRVIGDEPSNKRIRSLQRKV
jgi:hypothetical protein